MGRHFCIGVHCAILRERNGGMNMADRIRLLESEEESVDWEEEMRRHLVQIAFFAHERFIHLVVTVTFAILAVMVFLYTYGHFSVALVLLFLMLMVLMVPYIKHYFLLENSVQDMYEQYDKMMEKAGKRAFVRKGAYKR